MIYLHLISGLCNRLAPLISMYRICKRKQMKLEVLWDKRTGRWPFAYIGEDQTVFTDLFQPIPGVEFIKSFDKPIIAKLNPSLNRSNFVPIKDYIYVEKPFHLLGDRDFDNKEEVERFYFYPRKRGIVENNNFSVELRKEFSLLKPTYFIQKKIDEIRKQFTGYMVGLHIRRSDRLPNTIAECDKKYSIDVNSEDKRIEKRLNELFREREDVKLFIATDHYETDIFYREKYKGKIVTFSNYFGGLEKRGENSMIGNMNAVIDLFCLSSCNLILGSASSSFSCVAWLLNDNILEMLTGSDGVITN